MAGTAGSGRPGGNPDIRQHSFKIEDSDRAEPFDAHIQLRVTASMKSDLQSLGRGWVAFVREAISEKLEAANGGDR